MSKQVGFRESMLSLPDLLRAASLTATQSNRNMRAQRPGSIRAGKESILPPRTGRALCNLWRTRLQSLR